MSRDLYAFLRHRHLDDLKAIRAVLKELQEGVGLYAGLQQLKRGLQMSLLETRWVYYGED